MKKRIFFSTCLVAVLAMLLTMAVVVTLLYDTTQQELQREVVNETAYLAAATSLADGDDFAAYLRTIDAGKNRITLIDGAGAVLYDSFAAADTLENHAGRPEVAAALESGAGRATRLSDTLGEKTFYYALRLENGSVLRVASTSTGLLGAVGNALFGLIPLLIAALVLSFLLAAALTRAIVRPINALDLDSPLQNDAYEELAPLLGRMEKQNAKITGQLSALSEQQQEFRYITDNMDEGLVVLGEHGTVLSANAAALRMLGGAGDSYLQLCRDPDYLRLVSSALAGQAASGEMSRDGRIYALSANPVSGKLKAYAAVLFLADVTERAQAEAMRREFSANVSHELKTPLTTIMGSAEIIQNGLAAGADATHFAGQIREEAGRLLSLIEDIINLSRLDEGDLRAQFAPVELSAVCREAALRLADKAEAKNVALRFDGRPCEIMGVAHVLFEIVYNLCDNAVAYNKDGGSVDVSLTEEDGGVTLAVSDTGIGIEAKDQPRVFERFFRADKSRSKAAGGTGLGLSIVKHGAQLHGAQIELSSKLGLGTTVKVRFPK